MAMTTALLPIPAAPAYADPENDGSAEPLVVERVTPDAADEDSTLRVTGEVTNTTSESIRDVTVRIRYSKHPFTDREELDEFASGGGWQPNAPGPEEDVAGELPPEDTEEYSLSVPVEDLELPSYGVYPLVVEAVDGGGDVVGAQYTFLPYTGGKDDDVPSVGIAWVWPLMARPQRADEDTFLSDDLHGSVAADGRLGRLLAAGAQTPLSFEAGDEDLAEVLGLNGGSEEPSEASPGGGNATAEETAEALPTEEATEGGEADGEEEDGSQKEPEGSEGDEGVPLTWAVDPGTLDDILRMASADHEVLEDLLTVPAEGGPVRHEAGVSEAAQVWLREARGVLAGDSVVATPYANSDLASLLRNDMDADAEASLRVAQEAVLRTLELEVDETFALPPNGLMDESVYDLLAAHGATRFLLDERAMPAASWTSTTPGAQAPLPASETESTEEPFALVSDSGITDVLSMPTQGPGQSELALQRFAAETAMIAGEDAGGGRVVVASPDPGWNPGQEFAQGVLAASDELPWLSPKPLDGIGPPDSGEGEDTRRPLAYPDGAYERELSSTYLDQVQDVGRDVRLFNSILVDDSDPFRPALLRLESVYWREEEALAGATRSLVVETVRDRTNDVRVIPGEPVTLASRTGTTGILVANDLEDEAVYVHLSVFSENSERLSVGEYNHSFEIAPGAKTTVYVPLSARINGRTVLNVSLQNAEGEPISQETEIPVNATGLGTQALLISGIGLLILIVALAPRALRKWARRRSRSGAPAGEAPDGGASDQDSPDQDGQDSGGEAPEGTPNDSPEEAGGAEQDGGAPESGTPDPDSPDQDGQDSAAVSEGDHAERNPGGGGK
ncbi:hypothetical protein A6A08_19545 [Nocardiopsis sp. TSRI0078]|uniref:DUF6049 family protein n=1 Tax=unclassified Nocardiopsis TaxID=2649073 RepID=UPI00093C5A0D|nr:hypothetical protein A6A08_19545 [Nocardiopsis sp. TSRI0078]